MNPVVRNRRRPGDAVTFKPPSYLQAFASSGCEGKCHAPCARAVNKSSVENVALVGQILPPTSEQLLEPIPLSELEPVSLSLAYDSITKKIHHTI